MFFARCFYFFFYWTLLLYVGIVKAACANRLTNSVASKKRINRHSLQQQSSSNSVWTFISKLTASKGEANQYFGNTNAVAMSNNRIVIGALGYNSYTGAAYVFVDPNNPSMGRSYSQMAILVASDGAVSTARKYFGSSVDVDGDIIVVGASGAVYIFWILGDNNISQMAKIKAQNGMAEDYFGYSVAIHGNFILVGGTGVEKNGLMNVGSAYMFVNRSTDPNNPEWTQLMQFQPNDLTEDDQFGYSVAMDDQIAVVGSNDNSYFGTNAAYIFVPVDGNVNSLSLWTQSAKLTGQIDSWFGASVAVAGNSIVVGAPNYYKNNGSFSGAVFVFSKMDYTSSSSWTEMTILLAADGAKDWYDSFGSSVSISKDASTIVVGASNVNYNATTSSSGAAYVFRSSITAISTAWTQVGKYVAADRDSYDYLGISIAIENSTVVVGAYGDDSNTGSVYILDTKNSSTTETTTPTAIPIVPTPQPIQSTTANPTDLPTMIQPTYIAPIPSNDEDNTNTLSSPPPTTTKAKPSSKPTPPAIAVAPSPTYMNKTDPKKHPTNYTTSKSDGQNIIIAAMVILGVLVLGVAIAFFNYHRKRGDQRRLFEEQQNQQTMHPPLPFGEHRMAAMVAGESPIIANVLVLPPMQPTEDRTLEAEVLIDHSLTHAAAAATTGVAKRYVVDVEKGLPDYKDQIRNSGPAVDVKKGLPDYKDQIRNSGPSGPSRKPPPVG